MNLRRVMLAFEPVVGEVGRTWLRWRGMPTRRWPVPLSVSCWGSEWLTWNTDHALQLKRHRKKQLSRDIYYIINYSHLLDFLILFNAIQYLFPNINKYCDLC